MLGAVLARLRAMAPQRLALFTPYVQDLTSAIASSLSEAGFRPVMTAGMEIESNLEIGRVTPDEIIALVEFQIPAHKPDCLFLSCTNWRAVEAIELLEKRLGMAVLSSNQAAIEFVRRAV